jgi:tetratricopeptide (TPR) repeat protein
MDGKNISSCLTAGLLVVSMLAQPARAGDDPTDVLIAKAEVKYGELDFEGSLKLLARALDNKFNKGPQLVRIYLLKGICLGTLKRYGAAKQAFAMVLAIDPSFRLDRDIAPRIRRPFDMLLHRRTPRLDVQLLPSPRAERGQPVVFNAWVKQDTLNLFRSIRVWYRLGSTGKYSSVRARLRGEGETRVTIPGTIWEDYTGQGPLSWFAVVQGNKESELRRFGDELHPLVLEVTEKSESAAAVTQPVSWYESWWFWAIVGGAVVAGSTTAIVLSTNQGDSGGPHDFVIDLVYE